MVTKEAKLALLEHSQAKVDLYTKYLSIYLNVLYRATGINHIYIYDLLCGEGKYINDCLGSSLGAAKVIKDHYFSNGKSCKDIDLFLNDSGESLIEPGKSKIQRNRELIKTIFLPENVKVYFSELEYTQAVQDTKNKLDAMKSSDRALVFIDPYGYKDIDPLELAEMLKNGKTELLLFIPASFIHRFAESAFVSDFKGADSIRTFLSKIFPEKIPTFLSCDNFIAEVKHSLHKVVKTKFSSSFTIERDAHNSYCLLFFTNSERGFEKMLETKWALDETRGQGFRLDNAQTTMFKAGILDDFQGKVFNFISAVQSRNNNETRLFSLENEYLPKHTLEALKELKKENKIEVIDETGKPARSFYLADKNRTVTIRRKEQ
jgi:three-Cys-motif partner protein